MTPDFRDGQKVLRPWLWLGQKRGEKVRAESHFPSSTWIRECFPRSAKEHVLETEHILNNVSELLPPPPGNRSDHIVLFRNPWLALCSCEDERDV